MPVSRTNDMTHKLPQGWVRAWRAAYLRKHSKQNSILHVSGRLTPEQQRTYRFGPVWGWWGLSEEERQQCWEEEANDRALH